MSSETVIYKAFIVALSPYREQGWASGAQTLWQRLTRTLMEGGRLCEGGGMLNEVWCSQGGFPEEETLSWLLSGEQRPVRPNRSGPPGTAYCVTITGVVSQTKSWELYDSEKSKVNLSIRKPHALPKHHKPPTGQWTGRWVSLGLNKDIWSQDF